MSKKYEKYYKREPWLSSCYVYRFMYGKKREKLCDFFSCCDTGNPCKNYINAHWKILRYKHYHKEKSMFPTTLDVWKNEGNPFKFLKGL